MTQNKIAYEKYVEDIKLEISTVMENLYKFEKSESNAGVKECYQMVKIVMKLGSVSDRLRPYLKNNIPAQHILIDQWIKSIDVERLDTVLLVAMLRYTAPVSKNLTQWTEFRDKIVVKLNNQGKDSNQILLGLF